MRKLEQLTAAEGLDTIRFLFNNAYLADGISVCGTRGWFFDAEGDEAGDKVILEAFRRINEAAGEDMICLRLGGDEFAMITESSDEREVAALAEKVLSQNGNEVAYSGGKVAVNLHCGAVRIGEHLKYSVLCSDFNEVINRSRDTGKIEFKQ